MKFHLHVVDGNAAPTATDAAAAASSSAAALNTSESSAVLLFAHLTLRCGHLADVVVVSASTTSAAVRQAQLLQQINTQGTPTSAPVAGGLAAAHGLTDASESDDTKVLKAAGAVLTGAADAESEEVYALPYAPLAEGEHAVLQPYAYFNTPFALAEQSLRQTILRLSSSVSPSSPSTPPPYFDLIATTDLTTFEYVLDYYQQLRVRYGGSTFSGRGTKPVGVLHIVAEDPSRAARVLQRVLEMVLKRSGWELSVDANAEEEAEAESDAQAAQQQQHDGPADFGEEDLGDEEASPAAAGAAGSSTTTHADGRRAKLDSWVNHIDEAVHLFAQLFGVDVLAALV